MSAGEIAAAFRHDDPEITRSAIIGKVHRLNLHKKHPHPLRAGRPRAPRAPSPRVAVSPPRVRGNKQRIAVLPSFSKSEAPVTPIPPEKEAHVDHFALDGRSPEDRINVSNLNEDTCKWPLGDPLSANYTFCGEGTKRGRPYCEFHSKHAHKPLVKKPQTVNPPPRRYSARV
jgi:GcrA cell cycle regulator